MPMCLISCFSVNNELGTANGPISPVVPGMHERQIRQLAAVLIQNTDHGADRHTIHPTYDEGQSN